MEMFEGSELSKAVPLSHPERVLRRLLLKLRRLFCNAHLVHGDLSEYNVLMTESGEFTLIDWPQSVSSDDPRADLLLKRDVSNIVNFFQKRYGANVPFEEALDFVEGKKRGLRRI
jgi:RIO kinase 2